MRKKYRSGTFIGKLARHLSEHKSIRKFFAANLSAFVIAGTLLPGAQAQTIQDTIFQAPTDDTVIQIQNTLKTERSIQYPLETVKINQGFNYFHPGVDLGASIGDPVKPVKAGGIIEAGYSTGGYGNTVLIDHGKSLTSRYAHLSTVEVKVGDNVTTNTEIGTVGITGHSTGPHLHLEIRQNDVPLNPLSVLSK